MIVIWALGTSTHRHLWSHDCYLWLSLLASHKLSQWGSRWGSSQVTPVSHFHLQHPSTHGLPRPSPTHAQPVLALLLLLTASPCHSHTWDQHHFPLKIPHVLDMIATGTAKTAINKWYNHVMSHFTTVLLSNGNFHSSCHYNLRNVEFSPFNLYNVDMQVWINIEIYVKSKMLLH